ncbi:hypothetical protein KH017_16830, partial [bacterium]|nr:hypothetical protein [bacterium]
TLGQGLKGSLSHLLHLSHRLADALRRSAQLVEQQNGKCQFFKRVAHDVFAIPEIGYVLLYGDENI